MYEIPEGFFEYNKDKFTPEQFFNVPREAQEFEIARFKKKFPFGWQNRSFSELSRMITEGMGVDPDAAGEQYPFYIAVEGFFLGGGGLSLVSCCDEKDDLQLFLYVKWGGGYAFGGGVAAGPVSGMNKEKCKYDNYEGWFFEAAGSVGFLGAGADVGVKDSDIKIPLVNVPLPTSKWSEVVEGGAGFSFGAKIKAGYFRYYKIWDHTVSCGCKFENYNLPVENNEK